MRGRRQHAGPATGLKVSLEADQRALRCHCCWLLANSWDDWWKWTQSSDLPIKWSTGSDLAINWAGPGPGARNAMLCQLRGGEGVFKPFSFLAAPSCSLLSRSEWKLNRCQTPYHPPPSLDIIANFLSDVRVAGARGWKPSQSQFPSSSHPDPSFPGGVSGHESDHWPIVQQFTPN